MPPCRLWCITALALVLAACDRNSGEPEAKASSPSQAPQIAGSFALDRSHSGSPLPDFTFSDTSGKQLRIASLKGKPVLINLWATWCGPCVTEMPTLEQLAANNAATIRVVTISQDGDATPVRAYFARYGFRHLEPWLDPEGRIDYHYNTGKFPTTVYYDAQGREVWRFVGARDWSDPDTPAMLLEGTLR